MRDSFNELQHHKIHKQKSRKKSKKEQESFVCIVFVHETLRVMILLVLTEFKIKGETNIQRLLMMTIGEWSKRV